MTTSASIRRSLILPVLLTAGLALAACSGGGSGNTTPTASSTTSNSAPSSSADNPVAAIDPCTLLSQDEVTSLGLTSRGPETAGKSRGCGWAKGASYAIGIYADASQGLDALRAANSTTISLSSHDAMQTPSGIDCGVDIAITKVSSVGISVESAGNNPCAIATQYATLIEPKLPAQQK